MTVRGTKDQNPECDGKSFHGNEIKPLDHKADDTDEKAEP